MRQLIVGNWKMNGRLEEAAAIVGPLRRGADGLDCDLVVCPPATLIYTVSAVLIGSAVEVGGQDCHAEPSGAHTGDISAPMLRDAGARWVILGHSERRAKGETDADVQAKVVAALDARLHPIVCVGESAEDHRAGRAAEMVARQLAGSLPPTFGATIAYEPIWAIGTGEVPTEAEIVKVHGVIRSAMGPVVRILYGGSVKPGNAAALLALRDVDGALVGGASLVAADFLAIAAASHIGDAGLEPAAEPGKP